MTTITKCSIPTITKVIVISVLCWRNAMAGTSTGLPWDGVALIIANSITGPVALSFSLIALSISAYRYWTGHEMGMMGNGLMVTALAVAVACFSRQILTAVGVMGAVI